MTREQVLLDAIEKVVGKREIDYGKPEDSFGNIAVLWNVWLDIRAHVPGFDGLEPVDVAAMMTILKLARLATNPQHEDSWVDVAGYAACGAEIASKTIPQLELEL